MDREYVYSPSLFARANLFYPLLGGSVQLSSDFHFERDHYPAYELIYISSGQGTFQCGQDVVQLKKGDGLIHAMQHPHGYRADPVEPYHMLYVVFQGSDMDRIWKSWFHQPYQLISSAMGNEPYVRSMKSLIEAMPSTDARSEGAMSSRLYELLVELFMRGQSDELGRGMPLPPSIERGRSYLDHHSKEELHIKFAADAAGLSYYHFIRQFKRYYHITPKEYLTQIRIVQAKQLLLQTDDPITDIAETAGFGSYTSFLTMFLRIEGVSPSYYRKMWQRKSTQA